MLEAEDGAVPAVMGVVDEVAVEEAVVEAEAEVEAVEAAEGMTTTTMTKTPHLRP